MITKDLYERKELRELVRDFTRKEIAPHARKWDEEERFPMELMPKLSELGLLGMSVPEEYGGGAMTMQQIAIVVEELARVVRELVYIAEPLPAGEFFELLRPVDDETEVRANAQRAIAEATGGHAYRINTAAEGQAALLDGFRRSRKLGQ